MRSRLLYIEWDDSTGSNGWRETAEHAERDVAHVWTIGRIIRKDRHQIAVAAEGCQLAGQASDSNLVAHIPRGCIRKVRAVHLGGRVKL